jgi:hypothetical protein
MLRVSDAHDDGARHAEHRGLSVCVPQALDGFVSRGQLRSLVLC